MLARLLEVDQCASLLRLEDAQGREVPATFRALTLDGAVLVPERPLDLKAGTATHLVFILHDLRYKALATVLAAGTDTATLALPQSIELAERRKRTRGYLNFALLGLFSPMAAATPPEPSYSFAYEREASPPAEQRTPTGQAPGHEAGPDPSQSFRVDNLLNTGAPSPSNPLVFYVHDWMQSHQLNPKDHGFNSRLNAVVGPQELKVKTHRGLFAHGISYNFMSFSLPSGLQNALNLKGVRFESHVDRNSLRLGIRLK
ncbi:MAG: hypothetical protein P4L11_07790 [Geothrix sp.]|nr:hypothetical protein [Geothrix sp.]